MGIYMCIHLLIPFFFYFSQELCLPLECKKEDTYIYIYIYYAYIG